MREIPMTNGGVALVDDDDYERIVAHRWHRHPQGYAYRNRTRDEGYGLAYMHREILGAKKGQIVDHIDHNEANNMKANLRFVTHSENMRNRRPKFSRTVVGASGEAV